MQKPKHILVIRMSAMGDVAMTVPVIRALSNQYPELKITVLTNSFYKPFFRDLKNVIVFNADVKGKHKGIFGLYKLSKKLKPFNFDAIADLHNVLRSNILKQFFSRIPFVQINKGRAEKKALISGKTFNQLKTTHQRYADVFSQLGFNVNLSNPTFPKKAFLNDEVLKLTGKANKLIGIAPFAAFKSKMYALNLMIEVINELAKEHQVLLFGGREEEAFELEKIASQNINVTNLAGKLSLDEELNVISNLEVMLSMDSSNGHIAAMLGIKVITVWGITHPFAGFLPFNQGLGNSLLVDRTRFPKVPTSVYGNKFPKDYQNAIDSILSEEIIAKVKSAL